MAGFCVPKKKELPKIATQTCLALLIAQRFDHGDLGEAPPVQTRQEAHRSQGARGLRRGRFQFRFVLESRFLETVWLCVLLLVVI